MKHIKFTLLILLFAIATTKIIAQANPSVAILPVNAGGVVVVGATMDIRVTISNTLTGNIPAFKLRPNITMPPIVTILPTAEQTGLPPNWSVVTNTGNGQIRICNGTDVIAGNESRDIIIKVQGTTIGGPSSCEVQINYGGASCAAPGPQPTGNVGIDDFAASSVTVISGPLPLSLTAFSASLVNCQPTLHWETENEINTSHFEIERFNPASRNWSSVGTVTASNNSSAKNKYSLPDNGVTTSSTEKMLYRLKMVDTDGAYKFSNVIPVTVNCKTITGNVFPNPVADGKLYVSLTGTSGKAEGVLLSVAGQVVVRTKLNNGTSLIDVSHIANGTYIFQVTEANGIDKKWKVIVNK
ncbi:MAG: T9SS type A sorting domain-containing protein [Rhizobacter sp.]|nr:T9SS type A sorting domain-containing protein [Ferruginibacter sp.]